MVYNLQKIENHLLKEHRCLEGNDSCYYIGEYHGGQGYGHSNVNSLIYNLKKPISRKINVEEWKHKIKAIEQIANILLNLKQWNSLNQFTWIPMPPSVLNSDPSYDDRLISILNKIRIQATNFDYREILSIVVILLIHQTLNVLLLTTI